MCGIAGVLKLDGSPADATVLRPLCRALAHRGPDAESFWSDGPVAFGHRRLSILDLETGSQPLSNEDGTVTITFNGEIYNFAELRRAALVRGHRFHTRSDTETIVHMYEDHHVRVAEQLRGMFAF